MHASERTVKGLRLVTSRLTQKSWLETWEGKRVTPKFKKYVLREVDDFRQLNTNIGRIIYNIYKNDIIMRDKKGIKVVSIKKISEKVYELFLADGLIYKHYLYNEKGELISKDYSNICKFSNGYAAVTQNSMMGFIDEEGKLKIEPSWSYVWPFNQYGYSTVILEGKGKIGIIDKNGEYVIKSLPYFSGEFLTENRIKVRSSTAEGVVDLDGKVVVPVIYDNVQLSGGYFRVKKANNYGLFDSDGNCIFECIYPEIIETLDKFVVHDLPRQEVLKEKVAPKSTI